MQKKREKMKRRSGSEAQRVLSLINRTGIERGENAERRISRIFCGDRKATWPVWLHGMRKGYPQEDRLGIDFMAETDHGAIPIQIKSSERGVLEFMAHPKYTDEIVVVVIKTGDTEEMVSTKVITAISQRRKDLANT